MHHEVTKFVLAAVAASTILFAAVAQSGWWPFSNKEETVEVQGEVVDLMWDDLIPDDFVPPENPYIAMSQEDIDKLMDGSEESKAELAAIQETLSYAPVVEELDGTRVKIPAYITPLEYNEENSMNEFLLVPYVGACIHVPPPPANQVVHAKVRDAITMKSMYDPVWAIGVIRTETIKSDLAESGYMLEVEQVLPYRAPQE